MPSGTPGSGPLRPANTRSPQGGSWMGMAGVIGAAVLGLPLRRLGRPVRMSVVWARFSWFGLGTLAAPSYLEGTPSLRAQTVNGYERSRPRAAGQRWKESRDGQ